jgi:sugar phosphate isomerase/epimerase
MMKLGFLTDGRVDDVLFAADEGFDCVELALFGDTPLFDDSLAFKSALQKRKIALSAVSLFGQNYFDPKTGKACKKRLEKVITLTANLQCPLLVIGTGTPVGGTLAERLTESRGDQVQDAVTELKPLILSAQKKGIGVAFYNCSWENCIDRPEAWDIALPLLPGVGIKFDPSHPVQAGRDWKAELLAAGPHLKHVHAKDTLKVGGKFVSDPNPGLGDMRWEEFFGLLYHLEFDGSVCIEPHSALYTGAKRYDFLQFSGEYLSTFIR